MVFCFFFFPVLVTNKGIQNRLLSLTWTLQGTGALVSAEAPLILFALPQKVPMSLGESLLGLRRLVISWRDFVVIISH